MLIGVRLACFCYRNKTITLSVMDKDFMTSKFMGRITVAVADFLPPDNMVTTPVPESPVSCAGVDFTSPIAG